MAAAATTSAWVERANRVMPGGVSRDQLFEQPPIVAALASGSTVYDVDGRAYVDFVNNYTSLIHGHAYPPVVAALAAQAGNGTAFGMPNTTEVELAEELVRRTRRDAKVRFVNSGTEATMLAVQVARRVTGRSLIAKFEGGYHGSYDDLRVSVKPAEPSGPAHAPNPTPEPGVPARLLTHVLPYDDPAGLAALADRHGEQWACVIVEPMQGSAGMLPAGEEFFAELTRQARRHGFLLVFDEVMTYRLGSNGLQQRLGITPDLTALAKIICGGLPGGALLGRAELLDVLAPPAPGRIKHAGTFNGNPLTMAAGLATLQHYGAADIDALNKLGDELRMSLNAVLGRHGFSVSGCGSLLNLHGTPTTPRTWRDVCVSDQEMVHRVQRLLREQGSYIAPRGLIVLSTAHNAAELTALESALVDACRAVA